jgi:selenocysteine-specific elongation factor
MAPTRLIDIRLRYLADAPQPLKHSTVLDFFSGSAQIPAIVRLLDDEALQPGQTGWAQLRLHEPAALRKGDRFIVRLPSPSLTVGGGTIVNEHPRQRYRRFRDDILQRLETQAHGSPEDILLQSLESQQPCETKDLFKRCGLGDDTARPSLVGLLQQGQVILLSGSIEKEVEHVHVPSGTALLISLSGWHGLVQQMLSILRAYHGQYPLRKGMPKEELKSRLRLNTRLFNEIVPRTAREGYIKEQETWICLNDHQVVFDPDTQRRVDELLGQFRRQPYATPSMAESDTMVGADVLSALIEQGILVKVSGDVVFLKETYDEMVNRVVETIHRQGSITVAQVRDMFQASRKYALGLMEYLDEKKVTRRQGDVRVLR